VANWKICNINKSSNLYGIRVDDTIYIHSRKCIYTFVCVCACVHVCVLVHVHVCVCVCVCVYIGIYCICIICVCMCMCLCMCMCVCACVCMCVCVCLCVFHTGNIKSAKLFFQGRLRACSAYLRYVIYVKSDLHIHMKRDQYIFMETDFFKISIYVCREIHVYIVT